MFSHVLIYDCILILILDLQKKLKEKIQKAQQQLDMEKVSQSVRFAVLLYHITSVAISNLKSYVSKSKDIMLKYY